MTTEIMIGIGASLFTSIASLPQLVKLIKEKKAENISAWTYGMLILGLLLWVWYGIFKEDWIIIVSNSFAFIINVTVLILALIYKKINSDTNHPT